MKILIIGGTSSIGKSLIDLLSGDNEVITAGRRDSDIILDLNNCEDAFSFPQNVDVVISLAAHFGGNDDKSILDAESVNALGTLKICQASNEAKVKHIVLISSIFSSLNANSKFYSIYSLSKKHAEELALYYCKTKKLPLTILRPSQIYGNGDEFRKNQPFFYTIVDKAEKREDIVLYGSNDARRNYIHIDDLTIVISRVIKRKIVGVYFCAFPRDTTYTQIAKAAFKGYDFKGKITFLDEEPDIPDNIFKRNDLLYKKIDFYPKISIEEGIMMLVNERRRSR